MAGPAGGFGGTGGGAAAGGGTCRGATGGGGTGGGGAAGGAGRAGGAALGGCLGGCLGLPSGPTSSLACAMTSGAVCACDRCSAVRAVVASSKSRNLVMMVGVPGKYSAKRARQKGLATRSGNELWRSTNKR